MDLRIRQAERQKVSLECLQPRVSAPDRGTEACRRLHIKYSPPIRETPPSSARAATYRCQPGATDCDGFDELRADFWSALPGAIGQVALARQMVEPNLIFETETVSAATK